MKQPDVISETPLNMVQVKEELTKIKKRDGELNYRANKTLDYLTLFVQLSGAKAKELYDKLEKLAVPRLKDAHIHKLIDILPTTSEEIKSVLQGYSISISQENLKKMADVIAEYAPKRAHKSA